MNTQRNAGARALVIISTTVAALVLLLATAVYAAGSGKSPSVASTSEYRVRSGDTLWSIAAERRPEDRDIRAVISEIRALNDMETSDIRAGEILVVPTGDR